MGSVLSDEYVIDEVLSILKALINASENTNKMLIDIFDDKIISNQLATFESFLVFLTIDTKKTNLVIHKNAHKNLIDLLLIPTFLGYVLTSSGKRKLLRLRDVCYTHGDKEILDRVKTLVDRANRT